MKLTDLVSLAILALGCLVLYWLLGVAFGSTWSGWQ